MDEMTKDYYLSHHGILGQKWGKQNGPPYPLGASDHSSREKKMGWRKSLDKTNPAKHTKNSSESDTGEKKELTDKQKRAIKIGVAAATTALAAYGTYRLVKSGKLDKQIASGRDYVNNLMKRKVGDTEFGQQKYSDLFGEDTSDLFKRQTANQFVGGIKKLAKSESLEDTLKNVNPKLGDSKYNNNCTLCSIATFLRQHGLDVKAGSTGGEMQQLGEKVEECFKGAKIFEGSAVKFGRSRQDAAEMLVKRFGDNASGVCSVQWKNGGGHAFNWQIKNGIVSFFDGQTNRDDSIVSRYWKSINPNGGLTIARLDNTEINYEAIKKLLE